MKDIQGKPNYYSVLTAEVRYDNRLTDSEKLLYSELTALSNSTGECWATNDYLAQLYEVSSSTISRRISKLKKLGHIDVKITYKNNTKEIDRRIVKIALAPIRIISKENNTSVINITSNNTIGEWFVEFYEKYPKKVARGRAEVAFKKNVKDEASFLLIMKDLERRRTFVDWTKDQGKWIPHPASYLNSKSWLDEYDGGENHDEKLNVGSIY